MTVLPAMETLLACRQAWQHTDDQLTFDALEDPFDADAAPADTSRVQTANGSSSASLATLPGATNGGSDLPSGLLPAETFSDRCGRPLRAQPQMVTRPHERDRWGRPHHLNDSGRSQAW